jgi:hypothetical protein
MRQKVGRSLSRTPGYWLKPVIQAFLNLRERLFGATATGRDRGKTPMAFAGMGEYFVLAYLVFQNFGLCRPDAKP